VESKAPFISPASEHRRLAACRVVCRQSLLLLRGNTRTLLLPATVRMQLLSKDFPQLPSAHNRLQPRTVTPFWCMEEWQTACGSMFTPLYHIFPAQNRRGGTGNSVVTTATSYGPDGPGSNPRSGEIFRTSPDPPSLLYNGHRIYSPGGNWTERGVDRQPPCRAEVKERVKI
jgi:hypothetical protein